MAAALGHDFCSEQCGEYLYSGALLNDSLHSLAYFLAYDEIIDDAYE